MPLSSCVIICVTWIAFFFCCIEFTQRACCQVESVERFGQLLYKFTSTQCLPVISHVFSPLHGLVHACDVLDILLCVCVCGGGDMGIASMS